MSEDKPAELAANPVPDAVAVALQRIMEQSLENTRVETLRMLRAKEYLAIEEKAFAMAMQVVASGRGSGTRNDDGILALAAKIADQLRRRVGLEPAAGEAPPPAGGVH